VARGNRAYKSAKRSKELKRLQKQEEKRLRRLQKKSGVAPAEEEGEAPEQAEPGKGEAES